MIHLKEGRPRMLVPLVLSQPFHPTVDGVDDDGDKCRDENGAEQSGDEGDPPDCVCVASRRVFVCQNVHFVLANRRLPVSVTAV